MLKQINQNSLETLFSKKILNAKSDRTLRLSVGNSKGGIGKTLTAKILTYFFDKYSKKLNVLVKSNDANQSLKLITETEKELSQLNIENNIFTYLDDCRKKSKEELEEDFDKVFEEKDNYLYIRETNQKIDILIEDYPANHEIGYDNCDVYVMMHKVSCVDSLNDLRKLVEVFCKEEREILDQCDNDRKLMLEEYNLVTPHILFVLNQSGQNYSISNEIERIENAVNRIENKYNVEIRYSFIELKSYPARTMDLLKLTGTNFLSEGEDFKNAIKFIAEKYEESVEINKADVKNKTNNLTEEQEKYLDVIYTKSMINSKSPVCYGFENIGIATLSCLEQQEIYRQQL